MQYGENVASAWHSYKFIILLEIFSKRNSKFTITPFIYFTVIYETSFDLLSLYFLSFIFLHTIPHTIGIITTHHWEHYHTPLGALPHTIGSITTQH